MLEMFKAIAARLLGVGRIVPSWERKISRRSRPRRGSRLTAIGLTIWPHRKIFNQQFHVFVVYEIKNESPIRQLVILVWHTERLLRTRSSQHAAQQDELWSLASTLSRLQSSVKGTYFEDFVSSRKRRDVAVSATTGAAVDLLDVPIEALSANTPPRVTQLLVFEQLSGTIVSLDKLGENLLIWVARQSFDYDHTCGYLLFDRFIKTSSTSQLSSSVHLASPTLERRL
jgi:hypothetical protein